MYKKDLCKNITKILIKSSISILNQTNIVVVALKNMIGLQK
jgi:hypothetical protein